MATDNQMALAWSPRLWTYALTVLAIWTTTVVGVLLWELRDEDEHMLEIARAEAHGVFEVDHLFRRWNAMHGGIYVPVTEGVQPNPDLASHEERDVITPSGRKLTLMNPSYMMRQVRSFSEAAYRIRGRMFSYDRAEHEPRLDEWESRSLAALKTGAAERVGIEQLNGKQYLRMMRPLVTERRCMSCHEKDGYVVGQAAGAVSVGVPVDNLLPMREAEVYRRLLGYGAIWMIGALGIAVGTHHVHRQIDRRRRAEQEIRDRDQRFSDLVATVPGVVYQLRIHPDGSYDFPYISSGIQKLFRMTPAEIQEDPRRLYPGKLAPGEFLRVHPSVLQAARDMAPWNGEIELSQSESSMRWVRVNATPQAQEDRSVLFNCVLTDITNLKEAQAKLERAQKSLEYRVQARTAELQQTNRDLEHEIADRRRIEEALRESEANYREIFNAASDGIVLHDAETAKVVDANPTFLRMYGCSRENLANIRIGELSSGEAPYDQQHANELVKKAAGGEAQTFEWCARRADNGRLFWVEVTLQLAMVGGQQRILAMVRDITSRKDAENALRRSEEKYRELYQRLRDGWVAVDMEGRFTEFNRAFLDMLGYSAEELRQMDYYQVTPERWLQFEDELVRDQVIPRGYSDVYEKEYRRKDGTVFPVELQAYVLYDYRGEPIGMWGLARDITERRRQEAATREAQAKLLEHQQQATERVAAELQKVRDRLVRQTQLATIGQVSASIAHELRNPLGVIRNAVFLLRRKLKMPNEPWTKYLRIIEEETATADQIISDLMAMTRGKTPNKGLVSLEEIVNRARARCPTSDGVLWQFDYQSTPMLLHVDPGQIEQVLRNLFSNAIQAMKSKGTITLSASSDDGFDQVVLSDTGPGVPEEQREHIFEPLYTTKAKGTGLGLTICHQIITQHGGTLELLDEGQGATFCIRLPRPESPE